jgi:hypothetical protein
MWGDIPVIRLNIPAQPEAMVSFGRDEIRHLKESGQPVKEVIL